MPAPDEGDPAGFDIGPVFREGSDDEDADWADGPEMEADIDMDVEDEDEEEHAR